MIIYFINKNNLELDFLDVINYNFYCYNEDDIDDLNDFL